MQKVEYKDISKWKYELKYAVRIDLGEGIRFAGAKGAPNSFMSWHMFGDRFCLTIYPGYQWNGANVIADTKKTIGPSLVHDALWQLIEEGHLHRKHTKACDKLFRDLMVECGMSWWRAHVYYRFLNWFGEPDA